MNPLSRQQNIGIEWEKAREALKEATVLLGQQLPSGAISRAYYAAFHGAKALLLSEGIEVRSHQGLGRMFSLHFIKSGRLLARLSRILSKAQKYREEADYSSEFSFSIEDAQTALSEVQELLTAAESYLRANQYLS